MLINDDCWFNWILTPVPTINDDDVDDWACGCGWLIDWHVEFVVDVVVIWFGWICNMVVLVDEEEEEETGGE